MKNLIAIVCKLFSASRAALFVILMSMATGSSFSQDRMELGGFLGTSYYLGDLNPGTQFKNIHPAFGGIGRYVFTDRVALRASLLLGDISGSYPLNNYTYPNVTSYSFQRTMIDLALMVEYNFMSYDHQFISNTKFTPYITLGIASTTYKRFDRDLSNQSEKPVFVLSLPFGAGIKYKLTNWVRLGAEWTFRKTFVDDLDVTGNVLTFDGADPYRLNMPVSSHNNDWYSFAGVSVTFNLIKRKTSCNDGFRR